jgi:hypothetical protein
VRQIALITLPRSARPDQAVRHPESALCASWLQRDEGMASDELAHRFVAAKVAPSEDGTG